MEQRPRSLDVSEEFCSQAFSRTGTFNESRNISEHKLVVRTEAGFQRCERIVRNLLLSAGQFIH